MAIAAAWLIACSGQTAEREPKELLASSQAAADEPASAAGQQSSENLAVLIREAANDFQDARYEAARRDLRRG